MSVYKVTLFLNQATFGASESYFTPDQSAPTLLANINALIQARNKLMWVTQAISAVRIAAQPSAAQLLAGDKTRRRSQLILPTGGTWKPGGGSVVIPANGARTSLARTARPDQFRATLQYTVMYDIDRRAIRYLSMIPDSFSGTETGTLDLGADTAWEADFRAFANLLVSSGWSIKAILTPPTLQEVQTVGLVTQTTGPAILGVQIPTALDPPIPGTGLVHLRGFRRRGRGGISLNGRFYVDSKVADTGSGRTTFYLRGTEGQDPADWKILGTIQQVAYGYYPIQFADWYRVGIHQRGGPFPRTRGRRLSRLSLDP